MYQHVKDLIKKLDENTGGEYCPWMKEKRKVEEALKKKEGIMCYQNCQNEKYSGDCKLGSYPDNFICPPERAICNRCEAACYWYDMDESGLCEECLADDIQETIYNARRQGDTPLFLVEIGEEKIRLTEKEINTAIDRLEQWKRRRAAA